MTHCPECGGVIGRDCFNPEECAWIGESQRQQQQCGLEEENTQLRADLTAAQGREQIAIDALKLAYASGHYCDNTLEGKKCPGCMAGYALEKITGRKWTQEECE